ncbi:O-acetyl-ADP-ribose deacetylase [candidate division GN15 bacterium]|nr:O-acetyl-ADP-ribose deacetylase [candidate division GN15 bacterium]
MQEDRSMSAQQVAQQSDQRTINGRVITLVKGDITNLDVDSFVFYATDDLKLGSGYGGAISMRGGPGIQQELDKLAPVEATQVVVTDAGELKARYIIHANGPKFQEEDLEVKLRTTIVNCLKAADDKGIERVAFPPMGAGFYGVPLGVSARISMEAVTEYLKGDTGVREVVFCALDSREYHPFQAQLQAM